MVDVWLLVNQSINQFLEWPKSNDDTERRTVSLQQLSLLLYVLACIELATFYC